MTVKLARTIIEEAPNDWLVQVGGEFLGYTKTYDLAQAKAAEYEARQPLDDPFGANQSSLTMTVLCPTCCGQTHTIFTKYGDYRACNADRTHARVFISFAAGS